MAKSKAEEWLTPEGLLRLEGWARDGLTDEQIAHNMGVSRQTLYNYKDKYVDFFDALKRGKEVIDRQVENALLKRALGYSYDETATTTDANGTTVKVTRKSVAPDVTAQIFWLKNRKPDEWRDKREVDANVNGEMNVTFNMPTPKPPDEIEEIEIED